MSTLDRTTKYVTAVRDHMRVVGHATNTDLLEALRDEFPDVSATTVHRITSRLLERRELQLAPPSSENAMQFDVNLAPHDHFMCTHCGLLRDATLSEKLRPLVEQSIGDGCTISGSLTISGICKSCHKE